MNFRNDSDISRPPCLILLNRIHSKSDLISNNKILALDMSSDIRTKILRWISEQNLRPKDQALLDTTNVELWILEVLNTFQLSTINYMSKKQNITNAFHFVIFLIPSFALFQKYIRTFVYVLTLIYNLLTCYFILRR